MRYVKEWFLVLFLMMISFSTKAQLLKSSDTLKRSRVASITATGLAGYGIGMVLLSKAWYKNSLTSDFHFFNDNGEWLQVDKVGHVFSAYNESRIVYAMYKWAGVKESKAMWLGIGTGALAQVSLEVFDGFSDRWGFSWGDMTANLAGLALFGAQQHIWRDQKITLKVSSDFRAYSHIPITGSQGSVDYLDRRASDLYGDAIFARLLKDYNAQTNWFSVNPAAFMKSKPAWFPAFVNVAVGYSAENLYGGFGNAWEFGSNSYFLNEEEYPRYRQYLLSLDVDFTKIPTRSPFLKTVFQVLNIFKVPAPALEYNGHNGLQWHWLFF